MSAGLSLSLSIAYWYFWKRVKLFCRRRVAKIYAVFDLLAAGGCEVFDVPHGPLNWLARWSHTIRFSLQPDFGTKMRNLRATARLFLNKSWSGMALTIGAPPP